MEFQNKPAEWIKPAEVKLSKTAAAAALKDLEVKDPRKARITKKIEQLKTQITRLRR